MHNLLSKNIETKKNSLLWENLMIFYLFLISIFSIYYITSREKITLTTRKFSRNLSKQNKNNNQCFCPYKINLHNLSSSLCSPK